MPQRLDRDGRIPHPVEGLVHHAKGPRPNTPFHLEPATADEIAAQHFDPVYTPAG